MTHDKKYVSHCGLVFTNSTTSAIKLPSTLFLVTKAHVDTVSWLFPFNVTYKLISHTAYRVPSLTQGIRAALHGLVDLPCNSGHGLTHLLQHAGEGVLLPATGPVCCSQGGLCLGKTQGHEAPAPPARDTSLNPSSCGIQAAGSLLVRAQATHFLPRGPETRPHAAWPFEAADLPIGGWGQSSLTSFLGGSTCVTSPDTGQVPEAAARQL